MNLSHLTRDRLDDHLRREAAVDLLAGQVPATRMVVFDRHGSALAADTRRHRDGEDWVEPMLEVGVLVRALRPRVVALSFPVRVAEAIPTLRLRVLVAERSITGRRLVPRDHPFTLAPEGLPVWYAPEPAPVGPAPVCLLRVLLDRIPRDRRLRRLDLLAQLLMQEGHRLHASPPLARRLAVGVGGSGS